MDAPAVATQLKETRPDWFSRATRNQLKHYIVKHGYSFSATELLTEIRKLRSTGSPTGEELERQQEESRTNLAYQRRMRARAARLEDSESLADQVHSLLIDAGAELVQTSSSGSKYYTLAGSPVRVSDHAPNPATDEWIERSGCEFIDLGSHDPVGDTRFLIEARTQE
jgi:hypothetical protein